MTARRQTDFPVALRLGGVPVLVVGGGRIAEGRIRALLAAGAEVRVVAPRGGPALRRWAAAGKLRWRRREFDWKDVRGVRFVFTATDMSEVNRAAVAAARGAGLLANAADAPGLCDFTLPAVGRRGDLTLAVTSSGRSPTAAKAARDAAMAAVGPEYGRLVRLLARLRARLPRASRAHALQSLVEGGAARLLAEGDGAGLRRLIRRTLAAEAA